MYYIKLCTRGGWQGGKGKGNERVAGEPSQLLPTLDHTFEHLPHTSSFRTDHADAKNMFDVRYLAVNIF